MDTDTECQINEYTYSYSAPVQPHLLSQALEDETADRENNQNTVIEISCFSLTMTNLLASQYPHTTGLLL